MSSLIGLRRTLTWADFKGTAPNGTPWAAQTACKFTVSPPTFQKAGGRKVQLIDQVTVTVVFSENASWRISMSAWPATLQQDLLDHEQGHYDITALCARDCFIALMGTKNSIHDDVGKGQRDFQWWIDLHRDRETKIQKEYDNDTGHSQANVFTPSTNTFTPPVPTKGSKQAKWEGLIASAFTTVRPSGETAPDGATYKVELMDILVKAGITP